MTQFPSASPFALLDLFLSLFLFTGLLVCWKGRKEEGIRHWLSLICTVYTTLATPDLTPHNLQICWGMNEEENEGGVHWFPQLLTLTLVSLIMLPLCWIWSRRIGSVWSLATFLLLWMLWATHLHFVQHSQWESNVESVGFFNQHLHCFSLWQYTDLSV